MKAGSWKNWLTIGAVALLFVVVIALLVFLIVRAETTKGTDASPEGPSLMADWPRWDRWDFPLRVAAHDHATGAPVVDGELGEAIDRINTRLGFEAYRYENEAAPPDVLVTIRAPSEPGDLDPGGDATFDSVDLPDGGRRMAACLVRQSNTAGAGDLTILVFEHELGHCLGLAHDSFPQSIMCGRDPADGGDDCTLRQTPDRTIPPWISDHDRATLRGLYGPR